MIYIIASGAVSTFRTGFSQLRGIAVDTSGFVYVADSGNNVVRKITGYYVLLNPNYIYFSIDQNKLKLDIIVVPKCWLQLNEYHQSFYLIIISYYNE